MPVNREAVNEALKAIVANREQKALNYAVNYARYGLAIVSTEDEDELRIQLLYVLSNITHWRGPIAQQVRLTLKQAIGDR